MATQIYGTIAYSEGHNSGRASLFQGRRQKEACKTQYEFHSGPKLEPRQVCLAVEAFFYVTNIDYITYIS